MQAVMVQGSADESRAVSFTEEGIQIWLMEKLAETVNTDPADISIYEPLSNYGLDSLAGVTLSADLEQWFGRELSPTLAWDYPTIELLARHLMYVLEKEPVLN
jgi:acyl carrier protein